MVMNLCPVDFHIPSLSLSCAIRLCPSAASFFVVVAATMPLTNHRHFYEVVLVNRSGHSYLGDHKVTIIDIQNVL